MGCRERNEMPDADFDHLFLVARLAIKRGDRRPAERMFRTYRLEGGTHRTTTVTWEARRRAQKVADLLADHQSGDASNLPTSAANPWAAAQKFRKRDDPVINFKLTDGQIRSAETICRIFEETTRALLVWSVPLDSVVVDTSKKRKDPWLHLPAWVQRERVKVYLPWVEKWSRVKVIERPHQSLTAVELAMLILIEGHSARAIAISWRADQKRLRREFRKALDGYADIKRTAKRTYGSDL